MAGAGVTAGNALLLAALTSCLFTQISARVIRATLASPDELAAVGGGRRLAQDYSGAGSTDYETIEYAPPPDYYAPRRDYCGEDYDYACEPPPSRPVPKPPPPRQQSGTSYSAVQYPAQASAPDAQYPAPAPTKGIPIAAGAGAAMCAVGEHVCCFTTACACICRPC